MPPANLTSLEPGQAAQVLGLVVEQPLQRRLLALGFREGQIVQVLRRAHFSGPLHVRVGTTEVMMRCQEAYQIQLQCLE